MDATPIGFRVVGHRAERRRVVKHAAAFAGYAQCDPRAELERESYLSAFAFPNNFRQQFERQGSERGYDGPCASSWLWWDIDRPNDLGEALLDARRLGGAILERYRELDDDDLLFFLSGGKGVHIGMPVVWHPEPSPSFNSIAKRFCLNLAEGAGIVADSAIYSKVRLLRAPNSRHPKTGLHKRRLTLDELTHLRSDAIIDLARQPEPFDIPTGPTLCPSAADDWSKARCAVESRTERYPSLRDGPPKLTAFAQRFIREGELDETKREVSTFRVAAELAEKYLAGGIERLVFSLLEDPALDSGLRPSEVRHAIESGLAHARRKHERSES